MASMTGTDAPDELSGVLRPHDQILDRCAWA